MLLTRYCATGYGRGLPPPEPPSIQVLERCSVSTERASLKGALKSVSAAAVGESGQSVG